MPTETTCRAPDCDNVIVQGYRPRNPKQWCSGYCRVRTWATSNPEKHAARLARAKAKRDALVAAKPRSFCIHCGIARSRGYAAPGYCNARDCQLIRKRELHRTAYAADPVAGRQRIADLRALRTPDEVERDRARSRAWSKAHGWTPAKQAADERRRARKLGATVETFTREEIFDRDGWRCGICHRAVDPTLLWPAPWSVSLDHIVPLSLGGEHSRANTRCTHLECNMVRGVGRHETVQFSLI